MSRFRQSVSEKNCNLIREKQLNQQQTSTDCDFASKKSDEMTQEFLMEIIRRFPFPSFKRTPGSSSKSDSLRRSRSAVVAHRHTAKNNQLKPQQEQPIRSNSLRVALRDVAMSSIDTVAMTALPLDCWLKERLKHWVQLSGHEGTIMPASDSTLYKKRSGTDYNESTAYKRLMDDAMCPFVPKFFKEVEHNGESFIEIEDLSSHFTNPAIIDIKMGTRTFLESEVKNPVGRKDLYQKMIKVDANEATEKEHLEQAVTKLRYMQFRERESSTASLGFRIEAMKRPGDVLDKSFQKVKTRDQVMDVLCRYMDKKAPVVRDAFVKRLQAIRFKVETSEFFRTHEVIGSSLLFFFDDNQASVWLIDFAKALPVDSGVSLDHRTPWVLGNHEDGYLIGLDNLIQILADSRHRELSTL